MAPRGPEEKGRGFQMPLRQRWWWWGVAQVGFAAGLRGPELGQASLALRLFTDFVGLVTLLCVPPPRP